MSNATLRSRRQARRAQIQAEYESYGAMHPALFATHRHQHVAIHGGQVVDYDANASALGRRVRERYGQVPVLITQVNEQPTAEYQVRRPRLETAR